jgi:hypothetical protein
MDQIHYITDCVKQIARAHGRREIAAAGAGITGPAAA